MATIASPSAILKVARKIQHIADHYYHQPTKIKAPDGRFYRVQLIGRRNTLKSGSAYITNDQDQRCLVLAEDGHAFVCGSSDNHFGFYEALKGCNWLSRAMAAAIERAEARRGR